MIAVLTFSWYEINLDLCKKKTGVGEGVREIDQKTIYIASAPTK